MGNFVHLHGHTEYSLLDGLSKITQMVKQVKKMGMSAVAITDHGSMYGVIEFYKACIKEGIKPIIGCELYVAKRSYKDKEGKLDAEPYHLTVLAKDYQGYLNLMKLVSIGHLEGYYYRPRVDKQLLKQYHQGLIALSGCPAGEFIRSIKDDGWKEAKITAESYLDIFGSDNYFFELQNHEYKKFLQGVDLDPKIKRDLQTIDQIQDMSWAAVSDLSLKLGVPIVATNDFHYVNPDDATAQDALVCVQTGKFIKDIDRLRMIDAPNLYIRSSEEMEKLFTALPEAISNSVKIADMVNVEISLGKAHFPIFDIPNSKTPMEYLRELCFLGLEKKVTNPSSHIVERLEYELSIIEKKNYPTYFLIVSDFVNWAQKSGIITNTRGSAAGSLVLYCLSVTNIDPVSYMLPFERFLNPFRPSLPDIDVDLADDRRDEVIRYVMDRYGHDKVAHIITYGTMMGRAAIRDIGRVLAISYGEVDRIAKLVPPPHQGFHKSLEDAVKEVPELTQLYKEDTQIKILLDLARKVEGTVRHASVHAAGVVIAPTTLTDFTPIQREANGDKVVTQYDMFSVGEDGVGLVKIDILGIRNLSILGHAVEIVKESSGLNVNLSKLPLDDKKTYQLLSRGETMGLFQLEGDGMTRYLVELGPTNIFDIMAMIALYRPGPLSIIPEYILRKHDPQKISYFDPRMKEYLERSLGLIVYQDDVLLTAINLAGYSWEEADKFRKAMGKKIPEEMAKQKDHFIEGCITNGLNKTRAEDLFKLIEPFAAYGFNKAHAASYSMVSYQTAYMKANFPVEFMAAVMTAEYGNSDKIASAVEECRKMGIIVLPPDINKSKVGFGLEDITDLSKDEISRQIGKVSLANHNMGIRFGLSAIKNVGVSAIESILISRQKGKFKSLPDLCSKVDTRLVNRKTLESLIKSGALDSFGSRAAQMLIVDQCLELAHQKSKDALAGQVGLFDEGDLSSELNVSLPQVNEWSIEEMLRFEKELLGFFLHEPPFLAVLRQTEQYTSHKLSQVSEELVGQRVLLSGVVGNVKRVVTKKTASEMAFVNLSDTISELEMVVFPSLFQQSKAFLDKDKVILVWAKIDRRDDQISLLADRLVEFIPDVFDPAFLNESGKNSGSAFKHTTKDSKKTTEIEIHVPRDCASDILKQVNITLRQFPGSEKVALLLPNGGNDLKKMDLPFGIKVDASLVEKIEGLLGRGTFRLT